MIRYGIAKGFLYLLMLSFLATVAGYFVFTHRALPKINELVEWTKAEMPPMTLGPEGVSVSVPMPYTLTHPQFGPIVTFDTSQVDVTVQTMGDVPAFVTATKLYLRQANSGLKVFDLVQGMAHKKVEQGTVKMDAQSIQALYDAMRPWMIALGLFFFFLLTYLWKLLAAVFYSWFGLLMNFSRKPKLGYGAIFNVAVFALTPWFLMQLLGLIFFPAGQIPLSFLLGPLITGFFLYLGIRKTEDRPVGTVPA